jgi:hypothetical protein
MPYNSRNEDSNAFDDVASTVHVVLATLQDAIQLKVQGLEMCLMTWHALCISPYAVPTGRYTAVPYAACSQYPPLAWLGRISFTNAGPGRRVSQNKHSKRDRSMSDLQGECSCRRAKEQVEEEIQRRSSACP